MGTIGAGIPGLPGFDPGLGSDAGGSSNGGRDGSSGDLDGAGQGGAAAAGAGDYTLETLPGGGLGDGSGQSGGTMTASEQAQVLDEQLRRGYEVFDGIVLEERQRTQTETDRNPGGLGGSGDIATAGGLGSAAGRPQTYPPSGGQQSGVSVNAPSVASSSSQGETFPPPEDIPSGRDDDVVARQIREAAMREPDPELREALWDEYRKYTGITEQ